ncbi:MAG: hypothetical protein KKF62_18670, partial [Bacteroidetes bacterium]|nr:hypothetical protein [Bacteroidota bacterium]MBU1798874.1 hypothetical protein [Bacteroidota bacterium]
FFYIININSFPTVNWLLNFLSLTGIILVINSIPIFYSDFYSTYFSKKSKIYMMLFWIILWTIYILMNIIFATYFDFISAEFFARSRVELAKIYFSDFAPQIYILLGVVLFFGSIFTFNRRKIFLE